MADAKRCDVCGAFYEPYNTRRDHYYTLHTNSFAWMNTDRNGERRVIGEPRDCCETCLGKIEAFIDELKGSK